MFGSGKPIHSWAQLVEFKQSGESPVIIALDFENTGLVQANFKGNPSHYNSQAGIAILDTEKVKQNDLIPLNTASLITGSQNYFLENSTRSGWVFPAQHIEPSQMGSMITDFVQKHRVSGQPTILVGHSVQNEVKCLEALGFDFACIDYVFDTYNIAKELLELRNLRLVDLVNWSGIDGNGRNFHVAVNDAALTLGVFLRVLHRYIFGKEHKDIKDALATFWTEFYKPLPATGANNPPPPARRPVHRQPVYHQPVYPPPVYQQQMQQARHVPQQVIAVPGITGGLTFIYIDAYTQPYPVATSGYPHF